MGKQVCFYMVEADEDEFIAFIRSTGDIVILPQATHKTTGETFAHFRELAGRKLGESCHLWNRSISPRPFVNYFSVHGGCYCLDFLQSEVVNVTRSKLIDGNLSMGRLHIEHTILLPDGSIAKKSDEFLRWFYKLRRWIQRQYQSRVNGACLSARAEVLCNMGFELIGHRF
mgnify:FL=1